MEAGLIMPIAAALMVGIIDFGWAYRTKAEAEKSMRNAGRYLSTLPPTAVCGWGWDKAVNLALTGNIAGTAGGYPLLIPNWTANDIHRTLPASCATVPTTIDIYADVPYTPVVLAMLGTIRMKAYHQERWIGQ